MLETASLIGLFFSAMLAASPIPMQSEVVFVALQTAGDVPVWQMIAVAGVGNTLGALITYGLGRGVTRWQDRKWFPATPAQMARAHRWFERWGLWLLLLSWAPGGDLVCLITGVLRISLWHFIPLVFIAKTGRYAVVAWLTAQAMGMAG
ncbi:YqaA family protein [Paenirhodobacter sp. CAU 1674]|jgi:membrane protein YqaA with SNARE-associated domain|uniref:YqaA family protein n=1 Tax=Paenirhodobacter sp. CAU 1674 TaxID=3032596 RepID=UPI0023DA0866|nr:YqaA family protein [Paenirhodobacter sp. CAU 1674]MDF2140520.1 DedA family protein [Paenirhodobacter sp. CAU 1674]